MSSPERSETEPRKSLENLVDCFGNRHLPPPIDTIHVELTNQKSPPNHQNGRLQSQEATNMATQEIRALNEQLLCQTI